jgi:hypothetical protein
MPTKEDQEHLEQSKQRTAQITSTFSSSTSQFYQRLSNHDTGETKIRENNNPSAGYSRTVIKGKPCSAEDDSPATKKDERTMMDKMEELKPDYDASQL